MTTYRTQPRHFYALPCSKHQGRQISQTSQTSMVGSDLREHCMALSQRTLLAGAGLAGAGMVSALGFAALRWDRNTSHLVERLRQVDARAQFAESAPVRVDLASLASLPAPVRRYFRFALRDGQAPVRAVCLEQAGHCRSGGVLSKWQPFKATQHFSAHRPGFVWDATIQIAPATRICVRDAYIDGTGMMQAKILALLTVLDARGQRELDASALQRYLAEAVWFPSALLPAAGVVWRAIDDDHAEASLSEAGNTVSLEFTFGPEGEVVRIHTPARFREVDGAFEPTPWEGRLSRYEERHGMRVPIAADIAWRVDGQRVPYLKARLTDLEIALET